MVNQVIAKYEPLIYKVGYTHCPHTRFTNRKFGYVLDRERWERMLVLYAAGEVVSPAFVEAALIQHFKGNMVTNSCWKELFIFKSPTWFICFVFLSSCAYIYFCIITICEHWTWVCTYNEIKIYIYVFLSNRYIYIYICEFVLYVFWFNHICTFLGIQHGISGRVGFKNIRDGGETIQQSDSAAGPFFVYLVFRSFQRPSNAHLMKQWCASLYTLGISVQIHGTIYFGAAWGKEKWTDFSKHACTRIEE